MSDKVNNLMKKAKEFFKLLRDKEVPFIYKLIPFLGALYLIYPFDFVTDIIPVLGQVDDIAIISATVAVFIKVAKKVKESKES